MTRRAMIDASNLRVVEQLAIDLSHRMRAEFYKLPEQQRDQLMTRAWTVLRKLRKITLDAERSRETA